MSVTGILPVDVRWQPLTMHRDDRGVFTEVFRAEWGLGPAPVQWNAVRSAAGVFRGVHVHIRHWDYLLVVSGRATIGLRDLRPGSPTEGATSIVQMAEDAVGGLVIPPGVAHGFFFPEPSLHVYAVSEYWNTADELGCHWADPALEIAWPMTSVRLSERDASLPPLSALAGQIPIWRPLAAAS